MRASMAFKFLIIIVAFTSLGLALVHNISSRDGNLDVLAARDTLGPSDTIIARPETGEPRIFRRTDAFPNTNDQAVNIAVSRWWYYGQTADQITALVKLHKARLTQIRVENSTTPTFTVSMVSNTGSYSSTWWWYYGQDESALWKLLQEQPERRLISLDPYQTSGGLRFAAIMVPNIGIQARSWWWYYGIDGTTVNKHCKDNGARLVSLRPYMDPNHNRLVYAVIMVSNTGVDSKGWKWMSSVSISSISNAVNTDGLRVISLAPNPEGNWDALLIASEGERWWWWFGLNADDVLNKLATHNSRLIDVSSYVDGDARKYAIVELDNSNPEQSPINKDSSHVQTHANSNGWKGGFHGAYAIKAGTGQNPIVAYNSAFRFEPASAIKVLYLLYTLKQGVSLNKPITYYWPNSGPPSPNVCPLDIPEIPANAQTTTIGNALNGMIQNSNNIYARAFAKLWGTSAVESMAVQLGMLSTSLNQAYIGCGFRGAVRNEISLTDFAKLYGAVDGGTALLGTARQIFLNTLVGGPGAAGPAFHAVVSQEANQLQPHLPPSVVSQFLSALDIRWKAGGYTFGLNEVEAKVDNSIAGLAYLPFKNPNHTINKITYLFGVIVNDLLIECPGTPCTANNNAGNEVDGAAAEALRSPIRAALKTWQP